jgi:hypothetical protein
MIVVVLRALATTLILMPGSDIHEETPAAVAVMREEERPVSTTMAPLLTIFYDGKRGRRAGRRGAGVGKGRSGCFNEGGGVVGMRRGAVWETMRFDGSEMEGEEGCLCGQPACLENSFNDPIVGYLYIVRVD